MERRDEEMRCLEFLTTDFRLWHIHQTSGHKLDSHWRCCKKYACDDEEKSFGRLATYRRLKNKILKLNNYHICGVALGDLAGKNVSN